MGGDAMMPTRRPPPEIVAWALRCGLSAAMLALHGGRAACEESGMSTSAAASSYRIRVDVIVEARHAMSDFLRRTIAGELPQRLESALGGAGHVYVELQMVRSFPLVEAASGVDAANAPRAADDVAGVDKVLHLRVRETLWGFDFRAQDYDVTTGYLCPPARREVRQPSRVVDAGLDALLAAYSPAAEFQQIADDPDRVLVRPRLPATSPEAAPAARLREGDILIPVLKRNVPGDDASLSEAQLVPWTFLIVERAAGAIGPDDAHGSNADDELVLCRVESHSRRALGVRRRGRIDQLAIAVRPEPAPVTLQLVTQSEPREPLAGCNVYLREHNADDAVEATAVGVSDLDGRVDLLPTSHPVQTLWIKSGELLLARLPVVWGLQTVVEVPLPEDPARIRAASDLQALRTDLVDLVARRNLLLARGRAAVADGDLTLARSIAMELDKLPTRAQFNQRIDSVANVAKSPDKLAQARIDMLVDQTRSVLGQYLDPREISKLHSQISGAAR
jgi:hypothetical protein